MFGENYFQEDEWTIDFEVVVVENNRCILVFSEISDTFPGRAICSPENLTYQARVKAQDLFVDGDSIEEGLQFNQVVLYILCKPNFVFINHNGTDHCHK